MEKNSTGQRLLFVTNLKHRDRSEDLALADRLSDEWNLTMADANDAAVILGAGDYKMALIRNAWPSFEFDPAFSTLEVSVRN
ncbi:MAG: hypothetical protein V4582_23555 [Pseudomonadota bacterium]